MKRNNLIKRLLIVVMGVSFVCFGLYFYRDGVSFVNQQAIDAFNKALEIELANRTIKKDTLIVRSQIDVSKIGQAPQTVSIIRSTGKNEYKVSAEQHQKNVAKDTNTRMLHSYILEKKPLVVDSLNVIWQRIFKELHFMGRTALQISISDGSGHTTTCMTANFIHLASSPPLFTCYLGYGCEIEIVGFLDYYSCWGVWKQYVAIRVLLLFVVCVLIYFFVDYSMRKFHRSPIVKEVIVNQLVRDMPKGAIRIYQLKENLIFDAEKRLLIVDGRVKGELPLQRSTLLEILLNAEEKKMSDDAITEQLWPDHSGTAGRLQQVVGRLRRNLVDVDASIYLKRVHPYSYQLFI